PDRSVGAIQFYFRLVAVHDRYYLMVCTARALKGAPVVIRLVSRFNRDKEHRDAASRASPRTKRSLFSSKATSLRHRYSPTNSNLSPRSDDVETVSSRRSIWAPRKSKRSVNRPRCCRCLRIFDLDPGLPGTRARRRPPLEGDGRV